MAAILLCNQNNPPVGALVVADLAKKEFPVNVEWDNYTTLRMADGHVYASVTNVDVLRTMARQTSPQHKLYPVNSRTRIDGYLSFSISFEVNDGYLKLLDDRLRICTYLVDNQLTIADLAVFGEVHKRLDAINKRGMPQHIQRWYNLIAAHASVQTVLKSLPKVVSSRATGTPERTAAGVGDRKQEGKFVELPGAEMGKVVVRFPPEASGFLHIGHAKAALLNQYYQQAFQGKLIMRFDDTNPAKETVEFEQVILEDLEMLEIKPDLFTHTSQYFDLMLEYCERLMREGKAYVDDTPPEQMKAERDQRAESTNRNNSVDKNFQMWKEMLAGSPAGQKCCVRAKIDMTSDNGCMRDPTIYRCKNEPHPRTGTAYKVYPTYDFACPIVDAIENVTHCLRTMEYHDRDDQFYWFIDALGLRKPYIWEYSRLNMTNTVLSKRKLTWFVEEGLVDGWDDPRFPTVRGILRRGMTVDGLKQFIIAQGSSKSVVFMEWDKIWSFNKKVIDPIAPRYTALEKGNNVVVNVAGAKLQSVQVARHPKNEAVGKKTLWVGPKVLIDYADAESLKEGENTTFINWGNLLIKKINKGKDGRISSVDADLNLENTDFKKTLKLTWLCQMEDASAFPPTYCVYFEHIISKPVIGKDEDFKNYIGHETRTEVPMLGDPELKLLKKGDIIQLQRRGYFKVDSAYAPASELSGVVSPVVLLSIPDGHSKEMPTAGPPKKAVKTEEPVTKQTSAQSTVAPGGADLNAKIQQQGDLVRQLKTAKAAKPEVDSALKVLLDLKAQFKAATGQDWKPTPTPATGDLDAKINKQGDLVRNLKAQKAAKPEIDAALKILLDLKAQYKAANGKEWKPAAAPPATSSPAAASGVDLNDKITKVGDSVRVLKAAKAPKADIDAAVKQLLELKAEYKKVTGSDWKPAPATAVQQTQSAKSGGRSEAELLAEIAKQGHTVRQFKASKVEKAQVDAAVKVLVELKAEYKQTTGKEWKPEAEVKPTAASGGANQEAEILGKITVQGDKVRQLKTDKADKATIDGAVKQLLDLKAEYKKVTGKDWKLGATATTNKENMAPVDKAPPAGGEKEVLVKKVADQGEIVRNLKAQKAAKADIDAAVATLLALKAEYKKVTGEDFPAPAAAARPKKEAAAKPAAKKPDPKPAPAPKEEGAKKQTRLGLEAKKEENLPDWYSQVITKGELIEYYDVSGCYILRHWSYAVWKVIKSWFDDEITKLGVKECYFPMFVAKSALEKEKTHIADFAPEVAWVTKSGDSELAEHIAIRPTSETVMYPAFAKWVQSYRDLPIRLNQWSNVVRWEFKHPQPFLRTREFLWQEGHTAFANPKDAQDEVLQILDLYAKVYTDLLAIPVIKGRKTKKEQFAGADFTTTVEAFISASGRAIQGATSHHLGQNFSKMFEIVFDHPETQEKTYVFQNSWGITTRTIGVMVMVHADNQGLVLPPNVAAIQTIIVPCGITANTSPADEKALHDACRELEQELKAAGVKVEGDYRDNYSPGWKYNHWELKGVPIRIELGPKDMKAKAFVAVRRDTGEKTTISRADAAKKIPELLRTIQQNMFNRADKDMKDHVKVTKDFGEFCKLLDAKNIIMAPFCGDMECEDNIKADSASVEVEAGAPSMGAKSLCIPFDQPAAVVGGDKCVHPKCSKAPVSYTLFGRSY